MDYVLIDGDLVSFEPAFGAATVVVAPGTLRGSGPATVGGRPVCVVGDEANVSVPGCVYTTPSHLIPGVGTLSVSALAGDQQAGKTRTGSASMILVGSQFTAAFSVQTPAQQPTPSGPPVPDPSPQYSGQGRFITANTKLRGC